MSTRVTSEGTLYPLKYLVAIALHATVQLLYTENKQTTVYLATHSQGGIKTLEQGTLISDLAPLNNYKYNN